MEVSRARAIARHRIGDGTADFGYEDLAQEILVQEWLHPGWPVEWCVRRALDARRCVTGWRAGRAEVSVVAFPLRERGGTAWEGDEDARVMRLRCVRLSERERELVRWLAEGESKAECAARLGVSPGRVSQLLERLRRRTA